MSETLTGRTAPIKPSDVIIVIYRQDGTRVTRAHGPEAGLRLWLGRWVRGGYIARRIDGQGAVKEYGA